MSYYSTFFGTDDVNTQTKIPTKEYIVSIAENIGDEYVRGIGAIRKYSKQLIRCKDCKHHKDKRCTIWRERTVIVECYTDDEGFCDRAERKEDA